MTGCSSSNNHFFKSKKLCFDKINFNSCERKGTCELKTKHMNYTMIWVIQEYPMEVPGMPGAPFPLKLSYTIFQHRDTSGCGNDVSFKSVSGEFVFEINSGTLPDFNQIGIPHGKYYTIAKNNYCQHMTPLLFCLSNEHMKILVEY